MLLPWEISAIYLFYTVIASTAVAGSEYFLCHAELRALGAIDASPIFQSAHQCIADNAWASIYAFYRIFIHSAMLIVFSDSLAEAGKAPSFGSLCIAVALLSACSTDTLDGITTGGVIIHGAVLSDIIPAIVQIAFATARLFAAALVRHRLLAWPRFVAVMRHAPKGASKSE